MIGQHYLNMERFQCCMLRRTESDFRPRAEESYRLWLDSWRWTNPTAAEKPPIAEGGVGEQIFSAPQLLQNQKRLSRGCSPSSVAGSTPRWLSQPSWWLEGEIWHCFTMEWPPKRSFCILVFLHFGLVLGQPRAAHQMCPSGQDWDQPLSRWKALSHQDCTDGFSIQLWLRAVEHRQRELWRNWQGPLGS